MELIETIFTSETKIDNKSILNKLNKPINQNILDKIESGITLEDLENISLLGVPILKYKTQITIHGLFPELHNNYILGYKNIFQNKNKSIGVKYNAIDEEKRQRIAKRLQTIGFFYRRNSQGTEFNIMETFKPENFETQKTKFINLSKQIDQSLYFGHYCFYIGQIFGVKYLCFDLYINAIYEKNIELFLNKLGATSELLQITEAKKQASELEYKLKCEADRRKEEAKRQESKDKKADDLKLLESFERVEKTDKPGLYICRTFDYNNELIFKVVYIYMIKGKQKPRWNKTEYLTMNEALKHKITEHWSDSIYSGKLTGYKIK